MDEQELENTLKENAQSLECVIITDVEIKNRGYGAYYKVYCKYTDMTTGQASANIGIEHEVHIPMLLYDMHKTLCEWAAIDHVNPVFIPGFLKVPLEYVANDVEAWLHAPGFRKNWEEPYEAGWLGTRMNIVEEMVRARAYGDPSKVSLDCEDFDNLMRKFQALYIAKKLCAAVDKAVKRMRKLEELAVGDSELTIEYHNNTRLAVLRKGDKVVTLTDEAVIKHIENHKAAYAAEQACKDCMREQSEGQ